MEIIFLSGLVITFKKLMLRTQLGIWMYLLKTCEHVMNRLNLCVKMNPGGNACERV